jgi:hypothetical protein
MIRTVITAVSILVALVADGNAQNTPAFPMLIQKFICSAGSTCETKCTGTGGTTTVTAHEVSLIIFTNQVRRLWLIADGRYYVLGDDDRCQFGGIGLPVQYVAPGTTGAVPSTTLGTTWQNNNQTINLGGHQ